MTDQIEESYAHRIRSLAPTIEKVEHELVKCDAEVKKLHAQLKLRALGDGIKTSSAQETHAEASEELYQARLKIGVAKGALSALRINLKALEIGFEEWRTKMVNEREERRRYGA
jgi:chromosome segregation ATPase|tara:strand:- start:9463 stop:9804 length:342 start_codon:yes stop_codon:yes gene_type:complete